MGYRIMGKFLLCYLKFLSFTNFPQSTLFVFNQKNIPCLPAVKTKAKDDQSEHMAGLIWEVKDKMGIKACYARQKKKTRPPCRWLAVKCFFTYAGSPQGTDRMPCCFLFRLNPHDVAVVALMRFTTTSSYCFCVSNPSVMLLLSSNLGNTTAI